MLACSFQVATMTLAAIAPIMISKPDLLPLAFYKITRTLSMLLRQSVSNHIRLSVYGYQHRHSQQQRDDTYLVHLHITHAPSHSRPLFFLFSHQ